MGDIHRFGGSTRHDLILATIVATATSLLFVIVYGGCSWITSLRDDVGTLVFGWEDMIPFVPAMIIPYMSIDLFFVGGPFVCADRAERLLLAKRMSFAILVAGAFFLAMPLRFAFTRSVPNDWTGPIFSFLHGFDRPYNLFPSLHITLRTILAETFARHTRGPLLWLTHIWFSLIGFSTILAYQHHVIDIVGGFILAFICFAFIRQPARVDPSSTNDRIGIYYGAGAMALTLGAVAGGGWWILLLWPAVAVALSSAAYFGLVAPVFHKQAGRLPWSTRCLMLPVLLGHALSLRYYRRQTDPWNEIVPGLWMGRVLDRQEAADAVQQGVKAVLDLNSEFSENQVFLSKNYLNLEILDLTAPTMEQVSEAAGFIQAESRTGIVYVHCKIGYSRSAAVVGSFLYLTGRVNDADEAVDYLRRKRPSLVVRPEAYEAIRKVVASGTRPVSPGQEPLPLQQGPLPAAENL